MSYAFVGHAFKGDRPVCKFLGRAVCVNCGLARMKNLLTEWCVAKGCEYQDHPGFREALRTLPATHRGEDR